MDHTVEAIDVLAQALLKQAEISFG